VRYVISCMGASGEFEEVSGRQRLILYAFLPPVGC